jgi:hypothetical protein
MIKNYIFKTLEKRENQKSFLKKGYKLTSLVIEEQMTVFDKIWFFCILMFHQQ